MATEIEHLLVAAAAAQQRGDETAHVALMRQLGAQAPDHPHYNNWLGVRALQAGDHTAASDAFSRATAADPREPALWMNLAHARRLAGDAAGERRSLDAALAIDQRHFMARLRKAELLERLNETGAALAEWQNVLTMAASFDQVPPALADTLDQARRFVAEQNRSFATFVESELAAYRADLSAHERRRIDACLDSAFGRRRIYANECSGLHFPFLPADEFFDRAHFPWLAELEGKTAAIRAEFEALIDGREGFRPYVRMDAGTPANKWTPLDGSFDWSAAFLWEYGVADEELCKRCPSTAAMLAALPRAELPGRAPTAFFSVLRPHSRIPPHTGVSNTRAIVHLPLIVPEGCGFRVGGETRQWREGEAFVFDDTIEHEAWNDSDLPRAVLIFDVWNPHLTAAERSLLQRFYAAADASGQNPEPRRGA